MSVNGTGGSEPLSRGFRERSPLRKFLVSKEHINRYKIDLNVVEFDLNLNVKVLIAEVKDFVKAVTILIAAHYVFNVAYSKKLHSTYCFVQKYLLEIQDNSNRPAKVLNLMSKLKKGSLI